MMINISALPSLRTLMIPIMVEFLRLSLFVCSFSTRPELNKCRSSSPLQPFLWLTVVLSKLAVEYMEHKPIPSALIRGSRKNVLHIFRLNATELVRNMSYVSVNTLVIKDRGSFAWPPLEPVTILGSNPLWLKLPWLIHKHAVYPTEIPRVVLPQQHDSMSDDAKPYIRYTKTNKVRTYIIYIVWGHESSLEGS